MSSMIRIIGDCGHPWYVNPDELSKDIKEKPLKCPFCECIGAPIDSLLGEIKKERAGELKEAFKDKRRKKKNLVKKYTGSGRKTKDSSNNTDRGGFTPRTEKTIIKPGVFSEDKK